MTKKILVLGANGMLGGSLHRYFSTRTEYQVIGSVRSVVAAEQLSKQGFDNIVQGNDALEPGGVEKLINKYRPDHVFNCIGIIKQTAESNSPIISININSLLPHRIAAACDLYGARLIHFSTDCVFSGREGMYAENDIPDSSDLYGRSKLLGEITHGDHLTLRTSIIGHEIGRKLSLVDWFLSQNDTVNGYTKAIFSGLPTYFVAEFIEKYILHHNLTGLYHLSVDPIDKYQLLCVIKEIYNVSVDISEFGGVKIDRSLNSNLLRDKVGFTPPSWVDLIKGMHYEYNQYFA